MDLYFVCQNIQPRYTPLNKAIVMRHQKKIISWISLTCGHLSFITFCGKDLVRCKKLCPNNLYMYHISNKISSKHLILASSLSLYYVTFLCNSFKIICLKCFLLIVFFQISVLFSERFIWPIIVLISKPL